MTDPKYGNGLFSSLDNAVRTAKLNKPNDKSDLDRRYAIVITDLEKVLAYVSQYIVGLIDKKEE